MSSEDLQEIFSRDDCIGICSAFIDKLENPAAFVKSNIGSLLILPKELKLKAAMDTCRL